MKNAAKVSSSLVGSTGGRDVGVGSHTNVSDLILVVCEIKAFEPPGAAVHLFSLDLLAPFVYMAV